MRGLLRVRHRPSPTTTTPAEWIEKTEAADALTHETRADADIVEADRITGEFGRYCKAIWSVKPETLTGLQERATIARYWHRLDEDWIEPDDCDDWGNRTIAELVKAVLDFGSPPPSKGATKASEIDFARVLGSDVTLIAFETDVDGK